MAITSIGEKWLGVMSYVGRSVDKAAVPLRGFRSGLVIVLVN